MSSQTKQVGYAYHSSIIAEQMRRGDDGCYFVKIGVHWEKGDLYGPFDTIEDAESAAESTEIPWSSTYIDYPLRGSQFQT